MAHTMMTKIILSVIATTMLFQMALSADHTVGAPGGSWDQSTDLKTWSSSETFNVGDNLVFSYTATHTVLEVSKADYDSCSTSNPSSSNAGSPTSFALTEAGSRYFICGTAGHCDQGMKVEIKTVAAASPAPPTTTTPPSSDSPAPPTATTPPSSDSPAPPTTASPPTSGTKSPPVSTTPYGDEPTKPSSAAMVKMSVVSMVGLGLYMNMMM